MTLVQNFQLSCMLELLKVLSPNTRDLSERRIITLKRPPPMSILTVCPDEYLCEDQQLCGWSDLQIRCKITVDGLWDTEAGSTRVYRIEPSFLISRTNPFVWLGHSRISLYVIQSSGSEESSPFWNNSMTFQSIFWLAKILGSEISSL